MNKILFITSTRIGDAVLSTVLLQYLLTQHPEARFTIACGKASAPLFAAMPRLDKIHIMHKGRFAKHWRTLWWHTVGTKWDAVIDLRSSATAYILRARHRYIFRGHQRGHKVEQLCALLGIKPQARLTLWTTAAHHASAKALLPESDYVALAPTANWGGKQWPAEHFASLCQRLTSKDGLFPKAKIVLLGSESEKAQAEPLCEAFPVLNLMGKTDVLTAYACLQRCRFFVGNDSGLMHIAAASGIPTLGLFGPSPERVYAPWGEQTAYVRTPESYENLVFNSNFDHTSQRSLMTSLSVNTVYDAVLQLYQRTCKATA
jgi:ADP-heptose:LPS heptosyltransferase